MGPQGLKLRFFAALAARPHRLPKNPACMKRYEGFHKTMRYVRSMRGNDEQQGAVFSYINPEERIPSHHPLRSIREMVDSALKELWTHFEALYARPGTAVDSAAEAAAGAVAAGSVFPPQRAATQEQRNYNLRYRGFVGLNPDDAVWDATLFTKNRERLMPAEISQRLREAVLEQARAHDLLSAEHCTVDGTLIEAWASRRSCAPQDPPPTKGTGARGKKLLRDTHLSTTDPEARRYKKSTAGESKPSSRGHVIMENRKAAARLPAVRPPAASTAPTSPRYPRLNLDATATVVDDVV